MPDAPWRIWYEADAVNIDGNKGAERILYSSDGLVFVTYDHYKTFVEVARSDDVMDWYGDSGIGRIKVNTVQQDKHIPGTNNYNQSVANGQHRSILTENAQQLLDGFAGKGIRIGNNKEWVDFGKIIGQYYDSKTGTYIDTTKGVIHYDSKGSAHIVPARPWGDWN